MACFTPETTPAGADPQRDENDDGTHDECAAVGNGSRCDTFSQKCTHLGCAVHWNSAERSWDCPCHASRFDTEGNVLHGPAPTPLEKIELAVDATPRPDAPRGGVRRPLR